MRWLAVDSGMTEHKRVNISKLQLQKLYTPRNTVRVGRARSRKPVSREPVQGYLTLSDDQTYEALAERAEAELCQATQR